MTEYVSIPKWFSCIHIRLTWEMVGVERWEGGLPRDDEYVNMAIVLWCVHLSKLTKLFILNRCNLLLVNFMSTKLFLKRINWKACGFAFLMLFEKHCSILTLAKPIFFPFLHDFQIFFFGQGPS